MGRKFYIFLMCISLTGCKQNTEVINMTEKIGSEIISVEAVEKLKTQKILFGHKSVGKNIIAGIEDIIANNPQFKGLNLIETDQISKPGIYHIQNGKNQYPKNKCDEFKKTVMKNNLGDKLDIAFFKFCYVDFKEDTDIEDIFAYYNKTIEALQNEFPNLKLIHVTAPLSVHAYGGIKGFIKNVLKGDKRNIKRNQYNNLLRNKYKNIFDLAGIESQYPDGKRATFVENGSTYYSLVKEYSNDGGHLNKVGRFYAARELLIVLSKTALSDSTERINNEEDN